MSFTDTKRLIFSVFVVIGLSACGASQEDPSSSATSRDYSASSNTASCDTAPVQSAVGQSLGSNTAADLQKRSGAISHRILRPDAHYTTDYDPERLNIRIDEAASISNIYCG